MFLGACGVEYCRDLTTPPLSLSVLSPPRKPRLTRTQSAFSPVSFSPLFTGKGGLSLSFFFLLPSESRSVLRPVRKHRCIAEGASGLSVLIFFIPCLLGLGSGYFYGVECVLDSGCFIG